MAIKPVLVGVVGSLVIAGCVRVEPREKFPAVQQSLADRLPQRLHWNNGTDADRAAEAEIDALLAKPLDADAAVQVALLNNRNLQATYETLGIAQAELVGAGLLRNPVFEGAVRFREGGRGSPNIDLGIAFDFLDVFFIPLRKKIAGARLEAAQAEVAAAVLDLAGQTKGAFVALQAAEQTVEMRRQVVEATGASHELARRLREAGNNRPLDLANERALHEEAQIALASAELEAAERREALNRLMGVWGSRTGWTLAGRLPEPSGEELPATGIERRAIERSLDLRVSRGALGVSLSELGIAQPLGWLSELEVGAAAERDDGQWEVGPAVGLPIPLFSQGQPAVARAQAEIRRAQQLHYAKAVEVRSAARAAYRRVVSLRHQVDHYRQEILPLRQTITAQTQLQYNAMQVGAFQLLQAKRDQIEAGQRYLELLRDYWLARSQLELILAGRLGEGSPGLDRLPQSTRSGGTSPAGGH